MALGALTLSVTSGVQGRPFQATINGLTTGRVEVLGDGSPGFSTVNGKVMSNGLPYPVSTVALREYEPGVGAGFRDSRIDVSAATAEFLRTQALASLNPGRSLVRYRTAGTRQSDGSIVYSLVVDDDLGAARGYVPETSAPVLATLGLLANYVPAAKPYMAYLSPFGAGATNPSLYGATLTVTNAAQYPKGGLRLDHFTPALGSNGVFGYYQIANYGAYDLTPAAVAVAKSRIRDIDTLYTDISWDYTGTENFNGLNELFLSSSSTDPTQHTAEIAVITHTSASEYAFFVGGQNLGTYTASDGLVWRVWMNGSGLNRYFASIIATATNAATATVKLARIDYGAMFRFLLDHPTQPIDGSHYYHGSAVGIEPTLVGGTGAFVLNSIETVYAASAKKTATLSGVTTINEGNSGTTNWTGTVTLSEAAAATVTVPWSLVLGTANSSDFAAGQTTSGTVTIAAGQTTGTITVGIAGDTTAEASETFYVRIDPPAGYVVGTTRQVLVTINNDDIAWPPTGAQFSDATMATWTALAGVTVTANGSTAPDSSNTALRVTETTANSTHATQRIVASLPLPAGTRTLRIRARRDGGTNVTVMELSHASGNAGFFYDLGAGTAVFGYGSFNPAGAITSIGSGYYEMAMSFVLASAITGQVTLTLSNQNSGYVASYTGSLSAVLSAAGVTID
jgi:hypothetical protein